MKGKNARKIRQEMEKYRKDAGSPIVPMHDRVFSPLGQKGEVLVPVNHTRRARKHVKQLGDLKKGISRYGEGLVKDIMESRNAQGDAVALDRLAESRKEKKARKMSRGAIANAMKKKAVYTEKQPEKPDVIFTPEELAGKVDQMVEYVSNAVSEKRGMYDGPFANTFNVNPKHGQITGERVPGKIDPSGRFIPDKPASKTPKPGETFEIEIKEGAFSNSGILTTDFDEERS